MKKNQKLPPKHPQIVDKIVTRIIKNMNKPLHLGQYKLLYQFFIHCIVEQSANRGLLGDIENLAVSADGTQIKTGASPYGIKVCDCPKFIIKKGKKVFNRCDCKRRFSDFDATWGWDSYREQYLFGYTFYELTTADSPFDLPIFFTQAQANRNDSVLAPITFDLARKSLPLSYRITKFIADAIHDNIPTYKLMKKFMCEPFIPLNERNKDNFIYDKCDVNELGIPICKAGEQMVYNGYCPDRMRLKWRCPLKASKNFAVQSECINNNFCSQSQYGRVVYTYHKDNLRLFNKTPRGSEAWRNIYDKRTSSERSNKRKKRDYKIEQVRV